jgi:hypothetical protein
MLDPPGQPIHGIVPPTFVKFEAICRMLSFYITLL